MSDTIDDAAWPPQLKIGRWLGNVAGSARQEIRHTSRPPMNARRQA